MKRIIFLPLILLLFFFSFTLNAQNQPVYAGLNSDEQLAFVGMPLADLIERFGSPRSVIAERGNEVWQDDVVFQYNGADFYIYRDRIWQIKLASTQGVSNGDRKSAVLQTLGNRAEDRGDHLFVQITGRDWPLIMRVNFSSSNNSGQVTAIYIYRPDF
ncbi:MAG: hypothetical protein FWD14_07275 [Treponema sp.]|nr:hypothetical protein [Treponema sp.]